MNGPRDAAQPPPPDGPTPATEAGPAPVARDTGSSPHDPLCAFCGQLVPAMAAIIYHGVAYHPTCVAPTTGRDDHA